MQRFSKKMKLNTKDNCSNKPAIDQHWKIRSEGQCLIYLLIDKEQIDCTISIYYLSEGTSSGLLGINKLGGRYDWKIRGKKAEIRKFCT